VRQARLQNYFNRGLPRIDSLPSRLAFPIASVADCELPAAAGRAWRSYPKIYHFKYVLQLIDYNACERTLNWTGFQNKFNTYSPSFLRITRKFTH
jgi:hypothetical protein